MQSVCAFACMHTCMDIWMQLPRLTNRHTHKTSVVIHTYNPSSGQVKVGGSIVQGQVEVVQGYIVMLRPACFTRYHVSHVCVCMSAHAYVSFMYYLNITHMHISCI